MKALAIVSGGMDSVTMLYLLRARDTDLEMISFNYGQRHSRELACAGEIAYKLSLKHIVAPLDIRTLLSGSALTDRSVDVPDGHYAQDNMTLTIVPNRNMIMMSIAAAYAVAQHKDALAVGMHAGDHAVYPDCRAEFLVAMTETLLLANEGFIEPDFQILAPFIHVSKAEIVKQGLALGVPYDMTHSCYRGDKIACGTCGTCVERLEAFAANGVDDPIEYADRTSWRKLVEAHNNVHNL